jgi:hypothetical protein
VKIIVRFREELIFVCRYSFSAGCLCEIAVPPISRNNGTGNARSLMVNTSIRMIRGLEPHQDILAVGIRGVSKTCLVREIERNRIRSDELLRDCLRGSKCRIQRR